MTRRYLKRLVYVVLAVMFFVLSGCANSSASSAKYDDLIEMAIEYNHENCKLRYSESEDLSTERYWFERDTSNFVIWEDDNNYYVLILKKCFSDDVSGDGCKIGKDNDRVSISLDDRAALINFYQSNEAPLYMEENVEFENGSLYMR